MGLKSNIGYSYLLTAANYIIPLIIFPYVTRVLGAENIGICNWVDSIIQYFVMFSMMGISTLGIREIASHKDNQTDLNTVFTNLLTLNAITTVLASLILTFCIFGVPEFREYKSLFYIGLSKLITNLFLIEWFYKGIEDFKYIALRSIAIKIIYGISIFIFITESDDYEIYFLLTVLSVVITAFINIFHSLKFVKIVRTRFNVKYIKPFIVLGCYILLNAMYSTFNVGYLGVVHSKTQVGYYTTATKIFLIILSFYSTWTSVLMPRISALLNNKDIDMIKQLIEKSFNILYIFIFPLVVIGYLLSPEILYIIGGEEFIPAIPLLKISFLMLPICGIEQILVIQLMMPFKADKQILINSIISAVVGLSLGIFLIKNYASMGSVLTWIIVELSVLTASVLSVNKIINIRYFTNEFWKSGVCALGYIAIYYASALLFYNPVWKVSILLIMSLIWFYIANKYIIKESTVIQLFKKMKI